MTLEELEAKVQTLEDIEAINRLQRAYGYYIEHWDDQQLLDLFSDGPNVSVELGSSMYVGQEGIRQFFLKGKMPPEFLHAVMQLSGIVDVDPSGKTAKGRWYGFGPYAAPTEEGGVVRAIWGFGIYTDEYVKEAGKWKIKKLHYNGIFTSPYEDGWVKTPMVPLIMGREREGGPKPLRKTGPKTSYPSGYIIINRIVAHSP